MTLTEEEKSAWQRRVVRWKASGESVVVFSAREGIKANRLYYWASKLKREAKTLVPAPTPMMRLVRVVAKPSTTGVIIDLPQSRARVVVEPGFDRGTLAVVLEMLGVRSAT